MPTVWRKKAYEMFGFKPGAFSYAHGKVEFFDELRHRALRAAEVGDSRSLDQIFDYALWAERQNEEGLKSALDIVFFIPLLRDGRLLREAMARVPKDLLEAKCAMAGTDDSTPR